MNRIALDYLILVYLAGCGVLQIAAAYSHLRGLLFLRPPWASALLGVSLVVAGFAWFFAPGVPNLSDAEGGLNGNQQAALFTLGAGSALLTTLLLSSLLNRKRLPGLRQVIWGLEALREATYLQALARGGQELWRRFFSGTSDSSSGSTAG